MADQMVFLGLNRTTVSRRIVVDGSPRRLGRMHHPVSEETIRLEVRKAAERLRGPLDRLAELRAAAAKRMREMPDYPDSDEDRAEHQDLVAAFESLQTETEAWKAGE